MAAARPFRTRAGGHTALGTASAVTACCPSTKSETRCRPAAAAAAVALGTGRLTIARCAHRSGTAGIGAALHQLIDARDRHHRPGVSPWPTSTDGVKPKPVVATTTCGRPSTGAFHNQTHRERAVRAPNAKFPRTAKPWPRVTAAGAETRCRSRNLLGFSTRARPTASEPRSSLNTSSASPRSPAGAGGTATRGRGRLGHLRCPLLAPTGYQGSPCECPTAMLGTSTRFVPVTFHSMPRSVTTSPSRESIALRPTL